MSPTSTVRIRRVGAMPPDWARYTVRSIDCYAEAYVLATTFRVFHGEHLLATHSATDPEMVHVTFSGVGAISLQSSGVMTVCCQIVDRAVYRSGDPIAPVIAVVPGVERDLYIEFDKDVPVYVGCAAGFDLVEVFGSASPNAVTATGYVLTDPVQFDLFTGVGTIKGGQGEPAPVASSITASLANIAGAPGGVRITFPVLVHLVKLVQTVPDVLQRHVWIRRQVASGGGGGAASEVTVLNFPPSYPVSNFPENYPAVNFPGTHLDVHVVAPEPIPVFGTMAVAEAYTFAPQPVTAWSRADGSGEYHDVVVTFAVDRGFLFIRSPNPPSVWGPKLSGAAAEWPIPIVCLGQGLWRTVFAPYVEGAYRIRFRRPVYLGDASPFYAVPYDSVIELGYIITGPWSTTVQDNMRSPTCNDSATDLMLQRAPFKITLGGAVGSYGYSREYVLLQGQEIATLVLDADLDVDSREGQIILSPCEGDEGTVVGSGYACMFERVGAGDTCWVAHMPPLRGLWRMTFAIRTDALATSSRKCTLAL